MENDCAFGNYIYNYLAQFLNLSYGLSKLESSLGDIYIKSILIKEWERNSYDAFHMEKYVKFL